MMIELQDAKNRLMDAASLGPDGDAAEILNSVEEASTLIQDARANGADRMAVEDLVRGLDGVLRDTLMKAAQHAEAAVKKRVDDFAERWKQNRRLKRAAKVKQTGSDDVQVLLQQLQEQVDDLPPEQREDAQHLTAALAHEATKPAPAKAVLKSLLAGLKEILTGADADLVAELGKKMLSA